MKSKNYPNLHSYPTSPNWIFRKYSKAKRAEFVKSTGVPAMRAREAEAYKLGLELFNDWLGTALATSKTTTVRDIARAVLASKESKKGGKRGATYRSARNQITNHIIPTFGHLTPDKITATRWKDYNEDERRKGRTALSNTRKFLVEILARALDEGLIQRAPKLKNYDPKAKAPQVIERAELRLIARELSPNIRLLAFVMYKMGARPSEVLQYRWDMINFRKQPCGEIAIPGAITKNGTDRTIPLNPAISRLLRYLKRGTASPWVFPSERSDGPVTTYNAVWDRAVESLGMSFDIYNLRDTFITRKLEAGISPVFIGKYCQNSATVIEQKYAVQTQNVMERVAL